MAIEVALQNERGEILAMVHDSMNLMPRLLERSLADEPFFAQIDWFGDTTFNCLQMPRLLLAWRVLAHKAQNADESKLVDEVKELAARCKGGTHLYLRFIGD